MDPIVSIFGVCDAEADEKLSMKEIQGNADCWNILENAGMQNTTITDEFSMIDKDQDGYVSMYEAYDAANTLDRLASPPPSTPKPILCHSNFMGFSYTEGNSLIDCDKCKRCRACYIWSQNVRNGPPNPSDIKCSCTTGHCVVTDEKGFFAHTCHRSPNACTSKVDWASVFATN